MEYKTYITSDAWRNSHARLQALSDAEGHCGLCHADGSLEVHHATYVRLGCERVGDLIALCRECHREVTSFLRARRYAVAVAKWADVCSLRDGRILLSDPTAAAY